MPAKIITLSDGATLPKGKVIEVDADKMPSFAPQGPSPTPGETGGFSDLAKNSPLMVPMAASGVGAAFGGVPGAAAGSLVGEVLKHFAPKTFSPDEQAPGLGDAATNIGMDTLTQGVIPKAIGGVMNSLVSKEGRAALMASKIGRQFPAVKNAIQDTTFQGFINPETTGGHNLAETINVNKIFSKGMSGDKITNPAAILDELKSSDYDFAVSPEVKSGISDFVSTIKNQRGDDKLLNYTKTRLLLSVPLAITGLATGHGVATAGVAGTLILTNSALEKALANPETARLLTLAAKSSLDIPQAGMIQKALLNSLRGAEVYFLSPEGKQEPAQIGQDGSVQYRRP